MSLQAELASIENTPPPDLTASIGTMVNRIVNSGAGTDAQKVSDDTPNFILSDARGNATALRALLMQGPVVLVFYRGRWCAYCSTELAAYQLALPDIKGCKVSLGAISPEAPDGSLTEDEIDALPFEILSDPGNQTAKKFGLVYRLDDESRSLYEQNGLDLGKINGDESWELPVPAVLIVGQDRKIAFASAHPDYRERAEPADVVDALSAMTTLNG